MDGAPAAGNYSFVGFQLDPLARALTYQGAPISLSGRLFDMLLYFAVNPGRVIPRDELMEALWPRRTVDEGNLDKAVSSLRAALRNNSDVTALITTVPGRGYQFAAQVMLTRPPSPSFVQPAPANDDPRSYAEMPALASLGGKIEGLSAGRSGAVGVGILAVAACLAGVIGFSTIINHGSVVVPPPSLPRSIAVLPFANLTGDQSQTYLSDGLAEELTDGLGRIPALKITAQTSAFAFKGQDLAPAEIGHKLHVAAILSGSIRRTGPHVRVSARLIDVATGTQIWSQSYNRDDGDVLILELQIAQGIIASIKIPLLSGDETRLTQGGTTKPEAFDAYLSGVAAMNEHTPPSYVVSVRDFERAIADDPTYAMAYTQRARVLCYQFNTIEHLTAAQHSAAISNALRDAEQGVALAPEVGLPHSVLGFVLKSALTSLGRARAEFTRAAVLAPSDAAAQLGYAFFLLDVGNTADAVKAAEKAASLDSLTAQTQRSVAMILAYAGRFNDAHVLLRYASSLPPSQPDSDRVYSGLVETLENDPRAALTTCKGEKDYHDLICLAWANHSLGQQNDAEKALEQLKSSMGDDGDYIYAHVYASWGRTTEAIQWLQKARAMNDVGLSGLRSDPVMHQLREVPAYRAIEASLGFDLQ